MNCIDTFNSKNLNYQILKTSISNPKNTCCFIMLILAAIWTEFLVISWDCLQIFTPAFGMYNERETSEAYD
jgi:hypothetical protein